MSTIGFPWKAGDQNQLLLRPGAVGVELTKIDTHPFSAVEDVEGVTLQHFLDGFESFVTVATFSGLEIATVETTGAWGGVKIAELAQGQYQFGTGQFRGLGATLAGGNNADAVVSFAVGTVVAASLAMGTTQGNIIPKSDAAEAASSVIAPADLAAKSFSDATVDLTAAAAAARGLWINCSVPDAHLTDDGTVTITAGAAYIRWRLVGTA